MIKALLNERVPYQPKSISSTIGCGIICWDRLGKFPYSISGIGMAFGSCCSFSTCLDEIFSFSKSRRNC